MTCLSGRMSDLENLPFIRIFTGLVILVVFAIHGEAQEVTSVQATGCFLRLKDEANIPAREQGVLRQINVVLGDSVEESQVLGTLEDREASLMLKLAEVDLAIISKRHQESVSVEIAETALEEASKLMQQAQIELSVARKAAESDIAVRQAEAARLLAKDVYDRGVASRLEFSTSISDLEMADRKFKLDKANMDIEQADYEQSLQLLKSTGRSVFVEQQEIAGKRIKFELGDARTQRDIDSLTLDRSRTSVEMAKEILAKCQIVSPISGTVVELLRHKGEWVEAGEPVLRVIRLDTLLVEGYVKVGMLDQSSRGRIVQVTGTTSRGAVVLGGRLVFVSPETDSVNLQVLVKAEVQNPHQVLLPGEPVEMTILAQ